MTRQGDLQRRWYDGRPPPLWTRPISVLFGWLAGVRRALYRRGVLRRVRLPVPVIVIGNLTVGGAGKTPLTIALVEALRQRGLRPGIVSRGYGGNARLPRLLDADAGPGECGDEPVLMARRTGVPVAVGAARAAAARLLLAEGVDVIVADDGLQHYALARDIEVCVVDGARRFGNARLLPAGPLREAPDRLRGVDFIVCNGGEPHAGEVSMRLRLGAAIALADPAPTRELATFSGTRVHAVAGIGNPARFFDALRSAGIGVIEHAFPDHHVYVRNDLIFGDALPVLMTEKDAVKCGAFALPDGWSVPVTAQLPEAFIAALVARLPTRA